MPWDIWLIFVVLTVVVPWRGRARFRRLLVISHLGTLDRLALYASTIAFQWMAVAVVGWRAWVHGYGALQLGLRPHAGVRIRLASIVGAVILGVLQWLNLRRMGRARAQTRGGLMQALAELIVPHSGLEMLAYLALAITAGFCEEFLYRGFVIAVLTHAGLRLWVVVFLSSVLFGLAHLYQGTGGLLGTLAIGAVFGTARIEYDTLVPVILWHIAVDAVAGIAGTRYLRRSIAEGPEGPARGRKT